MLNNELRISTFQGPNSNVNLHILYIYITIYNSNLAPTFHLLFSILLLYTFVVNQPPIAHSPYQNAAVQSFFFSLFFKLNIIHLYVGIYLNTIHTAKETEEQRI